MTSTMRPIRETIPLAEALALMLSNAQPIERVERVPLAAAAGRVLAAAPAAPADVPPFDRAAMDGYAVRAEDTFGAGREAPRTLRCVETVYTGQTPRRAIDARECTEIATGAPMPPGADAVVMVEETDRRGDDVHVFTPVYPRQNVGRRGADIAAGQTVLQRGDLLTPARVGALAACGTTDVDVFARPRVAILSTGNEIVEPGRPLEPAQIYDINRFTLSAIVNAHGGEAVPLPSPADSIDELLAAIDRALEYDVLVFSGGSSVGERDLVLDAMARRGEIVFHGIAVKPGKPTAFGRVEGKPVIGMPGYPTSCLSNGYILVVPMLRRIARLPEYRPATTRVPLARRVVSTTGRHQFYTVRIENGAAVPAFKASGDITSMALADGYIEIPAHVDLVEAGQLVDVFLF
ncbi:MAG TPA: gephyrin-like molybdotransferase Glp [Vicinamibacterales bacterium]|jgi:molybdopterin molybdotransferase|nr:gephyrin-like molybdotransferase Glp [Vicinamibacterales bacterium]